MLPSSLGVGPPLRVRVVENGRAIVRHVAVEDYVRGAVIAEFAPPAGDAKVVEGMFQVQAVISRTYAVSHRGRHARDGYDLCATTHCQLYEPARLAKSKWARAAAQAVRSTSGTVLWFERHAAEALFHADCGGHTSAAEAIWGGSAHPYLRARKDDGPAEAAHGTWTYQARHEVLRLALNADARTAVGSRLRRISIVDRDDAGRAARVRLDGQQVREVRGEVFRDAMSRAFGPRALKSTWFSIRKHDSDWVFTGRGFGHGVGLCQAGALARISAGAPPSAVLLHYFPGTRFRPLH